MKKAKNITLLRLVVLLFLALAASILSLVWHGANAAQFPRSARAEDANEVSVGFLFNENDEHEIIGVEIPANVTGEVTLVLPKGVTSIAASAFQDGNDGAGNSRIAGVVLPASLERIGNYAFASTALRAVEIPAAVTSIGEHAFHGCSALTSVTFAERSVSLTVGIFAFSGCTAMRTVSLPAETTVSQYAFNGCTSLLWVYAGDGCRFVNTAGTQGAAFFPLNTRLTIVFPNATSYNEALQEVDETFKNSHASAATYTVKINYFVGSSSEPVVYERLHGRNYNYVKDNSGDWNIDTAHNTLRVQDSSYASTTWYSEPTFENAVDYEKVNSLLSGTADTVNLYCHETVLAPVFPQEPTSWIYDSNKSYAISDKAKVLEALGCKESFSAAQLAAMNFSVVFANENGNVVETPEAICTNGVYSVSVTLDPAYGSWAQSVNPSVTVNIDTGGFNVVLIVFLVVGAIGIAATVATAIIRKRMQDRNKRKQYSQKEVLEKFRAIGGESDLLK